MRGAVLALFCLSVAGAQTLVEGPGSHGVTPHFYRDIAVLESQEPLKDLPCTVTPSKSELGFDLRFHAGYEASFPLRALAGGENMLTMVSRVTPQTAQGRPAYFVQRVHVPAIEDHASGDASIEGRFDLGEGAYHVDWLARDREQRVCSSHWDVAASLTAKDKGLPLDLAAGQVAGHARDPFEKEPAAGRGVSNAPLHVRLIVNFAPQDPDSASLRPTDLEGLVAILRTIGEDPRIGKFSITAVNIAAEQVLYRQEDAASIDLRALGEALKSLRLATVDLTRLGWKHGQAEFLANIVSEGMKGGPQDALIVISPKVMLDDGAPRGILKQIGEAECPVFYMNYELDPRANPWRDAIGRVVRQLKGFEYTISHPRDPIRAWSEVASRLLAGKVMAQTSEAAFQ